MNKRIFVILGIFMASLSILPAAISEALHSFDAARPAAVVELSQPNVAINAPQLLTPTITLLPNCGSPATNPGGVQYIVLFEDWVISDSLTLFWDGNLKQTWLAGAHADTFAQTFASDVPTATVTYSVTAVAGSGATASQIFSVPCQPGQTAQPPVGRDLVTSRRQAEGIVATSSQILLGPHICTDYGDPFSPLNSPWAPGFHTYQYRIQIPAGYNHNDLRIELFDPDSINASYNGPFTIPRTQAAIDAGLAPTTTGSCSSDQKNACLIDTGELALYNDGTLPLDRINPYFFGRVDENRGNGPALGNGQCGSPSSYDPAFNTATHFQLYYLKEGQGADQTRVNLAGYTGQTGETARDCPPGAPIGCSGGDHLSDGYWVSPGAPLSFDQLAAVPVDPGSETSFQLDLSDDLPGHEIDPETGDRFVYLEVTALSGASENVFEIWAGPPGYINQVPSEANARNLHTLNTPRSHDATGVEIFAIQNLPQNSFVSIQVDTPLTDLGPVYAGQEIYISMFDTDAGSAPPITFFLDTMSINDWSLTFAAAGVPDPDGHIRNCEPGSCNNQWITPPYSITMPGDNENCDYTNPDTSCYPFYGGRLHARHQAGNVDTFVWEATPPPEPMALDSTAGCSAFPISIHEGSRSVTPPGTGTNPYPPASEFDYPFDPPVYGDFLNHNPDVLLEQATTGDVFKIENGFGSSNFGWLAWNTYAPSSANELGGSLTWPGNSQDYQTIAPGPTPPGFPHGVWGYIEPGDDTDTAMNIGDWVSGSTGSINSNTVRNTIEGHIDLGRTLRLPVWTESASSGTNGKYLISGFALFRLHGYTLNQTAGSWLLLEFIDWDESCGQLLTVNLEGPYDGVAGVDYLYTASVTPSPTESVTYIWQADGQTITHTGSLSDTLTMNWTRLGLQEIQVTAVLSNEIGTASQYVNVLASPEAIPWLFGGGSEIYPARQAPRGLVGTANPSVFGPHICTAYGDPFSPLNSPWRPGPHTYQYLIQIPGDYPESTVRVELFDPDSMNQPDNTFTVTRTQLAITAGLSPTASLDCVASDSNQINPCALDTGEFNLVLSDTYDLAQINPLWFARVDENRGTGPPPGNGACGSPSTYNPAYNTRTLYQLHYLMDDNGTPTRVNLASYTGQTGDGVRDAGDHDTDLRWVSPGTPLSFDQTVPVPTDGGSATTFEIDLTNDVPGILTNPETGERFLLLDITTIDGSSENSFHIWAGPAAYTATLPSSVNDRNLQLLNNPGGFSTHGVTVYAQETLVQNWNMQGTRIEFPLTYAPAAAAGQAMFVSLFDSDSGSAPPLTFLADSIPAEEWSLAYAVPGEPDPDGQVRNCEPGSCNNQWVNPPYTVMFPADFSNGRVLVEYEGGWHDTAAWHLTGNGSLPVSGPDSGTVNATYQFLADASYLRFTEPITYVWAIDGQPVITHVGGLTDVVSVSWPAVGSKQLVVSATNSYGLPANRVTVVGQHQIMIGDGPDLTINGTPQLLTELPIVAQQPVSFAVTIENSSDADINSSFFVDIFLDPTTVLSTGIPITESSGSTAVASLTAGESRVITLTAPLGFSGEIPTHTVYAMVDSHLEIAESDETNNVSSPLLVTINDTLFADLTFAAPPVLANDGVVLPGEAVTFTLAIANSGSATVTTHFRVDLFLNPAVVLTDSIPISQSDGFVLVSGLAAGETRTVTITAAAGFSAQPATQPVYGMVDSTQLIPELDETNNVSPPAAVRVGWHLYMTGVLRE